MSGHGHGNHRRERFAHREHELAENRRRLGRHDPEPDPYVADADDENAAEAWDLLHPPEETELRALWGDR